MKQTAVEWLLKELDINPKATILKDLIEQAKEMEKQQQGYSEEDMKQFAWECVTNFLSNDDNKVEIKLVDVIIDRVNNKFEQFKKK
jgi:6-phosphogluconate dehydrogenase